MNKLLDKNIKITINVDDVKLNFLNKKDNIGDTEIHSCARVLVERYIKFLLDNKIGEDLENYLKKSDKLIQDYNKNPNNGSYKNFDYKIDNIKFEIKCYHNFEKSGINISKKQRLEIGEDVLFILIYISVSNNIITINDIVVRQFKNLKIHNKQIIGV